MAWCQGRMDGTCLEPQWRDSVCADPSKSHVHPRWLKAQYVFLALTMTSVSFLKLSAISLRSLSLSLMYCAFFCIIQRTPSHFNMTPIPCRESNEPPPPFLMRPPPNVGGSTDSHEKLWWLWKIMMILCT